MYGDYGILVDGRSVTLTLNTDDTYSFEIVKWQSADIIELDSLSRGIVRIVDEHNFELVDEENHYPIEIVSKEILLPKRPISFDQCNITIADSLFCFNGVYKNGKTKFSGGWDENNNKRGTWFYYNELGEVIKEKYHEPKFR